MLCRCTLRSHPLCVDCAVRCITTGLLPQVNLSRYQLDHQWVWYLMLVYRACLHDVCHVCGQGLVMVVRIIKFAVHVVVCWFVGLHAV